MGVPISSLPAASALTGAELLPVVQSGQTKQTTTDAIPYSPAGTGAVTTTVQAKLRESVSIADFLTTTTPSSSQVAVAFQAAINSGTKKVRVTRDYAINAPVSLVANQIIDFDGGSLTVDSGTVAPNGILYGNAKSGIKIADPVIDASATTGIDGINLVDCPNGVVIDGTLTKCNISLQASNNTSRMGYRVRGTVVNMSAWAGTACYISSANGVDLDSLELYGGLEGVGIYNNARNVRHSDIYSHNHTQDGFVVIAGQRIDYSGCIASSNGQSGFTTQRQTSAENTKRVTYTGCQAYDNAYDGFDLRGANSTAWGSDILITATGCIATGNAGAGFYVVLAEGVQLIGCQAQSNQQQNFFVDNSERVQLVGCQSSSGANSVSAGPNKAGILVYNSLGVQVAGCISSNSNGATQNYGLSFTGTAANCSVAGGYYQNNTTNPVYSSAAAYVTGAAMQDATNVWTHGIVANSGAYIESGYSAPTHVRPKGSTFQRTDGGGGEVYVSNGGGSWTQL